MEEKTQNFMAKLIKVYDGEFSSEFIAKHRNTVFYKIANFTTPKGTKVSAVLNKEQIGELINELDSLQDSRRLQAKMKRLGIEFDE
jgi:hypothetical protein